MFISTSPPEADIQLQVLGIFGSVLLFWIIVAVIMGIRNQVSQTPINQLITMDCLLRLTKIPNILVSSKAFNYWGLNSPLSCTIRTTFSVTTSLVPRLLSIAIAFYRWTYVCRSTSVLTSAQRRTFFLRLSSTFALLTLGLTFGAVYYMDQYTFYHNCRGEKNMTAVTNWDLPITHPFRLLIHGSFLGNLFVSPFLYILIFLFRRSKSQSHNLGINSKSLKARRRRNVVSARFNFLIWLSELIIVLPYLNKNRWGENDTSVVLYLVLDSCCTPLLYYVGIESNRERMTNFLAKKMNWMTNSIGAEEVGPQDTSHRRERRGALHNWESIELVFK